MDLKKFFLEDNKSGWKTRETLLSKNEPEIYKLLNEYVVLHELSDLSFKEKIYLFINNLTSKPKCLNEGCNKDVKFKNTLKKGYSKFCSLKCANESSLIKELTIQGNKEKYGVNYFSQTEGFIEKVKKTKKERYGDEKYNNLEKAFKTKKEKYGDGKYINTDKVKETNLKKYGVENPFSSKEIQDKIKKTIIKKYGVDHPSKATEVKELKEQIRINKLKDRYKGLISINEETFTMKCDNCGSEYEITKGLLHERDRSNHTLCTICNPIKKSTSFAEKEIVKYIKSLLPNTEISENVRVLDNKEIDIYLPSLNLGIEYNGVYWHSELYKNKNYHLDKTKIANEKGIRLIHIFSDEWEFKKDIVKSRIKNILGLNNKKIYARKCLIKEIKPKDSKLFLNNNHLQGNVNSSIKLGLYYGEELVSVMTFNKGRVIMGGKKDEYELIRFANKIGYSVVGGASKLLKYFIKTYKPSKLISYADLRWSNGDLYEKLGFNFIHDSKPNYHYIKEGLRYHRFNFRKGVLVNEGFDKDKSEHEIMLERGIYRIYDCGNKRYELKIKEYDK